MEKIKRNLVGTLDYTQQFDSLINFMDGLSAELL